MLRSDRCELGLNFGETILGTKGWPRGYVGQVQFVLELNLEMRSFHGRV